jgi:hypothetical protein
MQMLLTFLQMMKLSDNFIAKIIQKLNWKYQKITWTWGWDKFKEFKFKRI